MTGEMVPLRPVREVRDVEQVASRVTRGGRPPYRVITVSDADIATILREIAGGTVPTLADELAAAITGDLPGLGRGGAS